MIFLHISNGSEIPLMSIKLKLFVDIFVSFLKKRGNHYPIWIENIMVLDL